MKAFTRTEAQTQQVELTDVIPPEPGPGEVAVAIEAFGVGIHDRYFIPPNGPFPYTIGIEGAGVVRELGADVEGVEVGDRVMVSSPMDPKGGTWAELAVVARNGVMAIPDDLDFTTAAGIPVAGKSAIDSVHALELHEGETLYIAGASGAIGTLVVQLATQRGVRVVGSASASNHEYLLSLGAEIAVDYHDATWPDEVRRWAGGGVDAALAIQPGTAAASVAVTRDDGRVITVSGDPSAHERGIRVEQFTHRPDAGADLGELIDAITSGRVQVVLEHVYEFGQALTALEKTETRHARGKLVVTADPTH